MNDLTDLARQLDLLERIQSDLAAVLLRTDDARYDLIQLRKRLADQTASMDSMAAPMIARLQDVDLLREYRTRFSRMRSTAALHQANWSAVRIGEDDAEYQLSIKRIRAANAEFFAWMRDTFHRLADAAPPFPTR